MSFPHAPGTKIRALKEARLQALLTGEAQVVYKQGLMWHTTSLADWHERLATTHLHSNITRMVIIEPKKGKA